MTAPDFDAVAAKLYRDQFPRPGNYANAYRTIADIAAALRATYDRGREDAMEDHVCEPCSHAPWDFG